MNGSSSLMSNSCAARVQAQARRIDQLERGTARSTERSVADIGSQCAAAPVKAPPWLVAANWDRLRPGMSEDEVAKILGPSTSERAGDGATKLLLYAVESPGRESSWQVGSKFRPER